MSDSYPQENFRFLVEIDGISFASFNQVMMPGGEAQVIEYREGSDPVSRTRKLPGPVHYDNLVLIRGVSAGNELYQWWKSVVDGNVQRRNLSVVLLDEERNPVKRWSFTQAWPSAYRISELDSQRGEVLSEILEITFEEMEQADE